MITVTLLKPTPVIVTGVPTGPLDGEICVIEKKTTKSVAELSLPVAFLTTILPVVAPCGTVACSSLGETCVKAAGLPLNATFVTVSRLAPSIVTLPPVVPCVGVNEEMVGLLVWASSAISAADSVRL